MQSSGVRCYKQNQCKHIWIKEDVAHTLMRQQPNAQKPKTRTTQYNNDLFINPLSYTHIQNTVTFIPRDQTCIKKSTTLNGVYQ